MKDHKREKWEGSCRGRDDRGFGWKDARTLHSRHAFRVSVLRSSSTQHSGITRSAYLDFSSLQLPADVRLESNNRSFSRSAS
jgi:hypothetical protein